jgi:hypothetical protein
MRVEPIHARDADMRLKDFREDAVPIVHLAAVQIGPWTLPVVEVDATNRPDVADLARVHAVERVESRNTVCLIGYGETGILYHGVKGQQAPTGERPKV